ncbi:MAG TPA: ornithine carbamoyltransferase [Candidatus Micrarchaeaceae archaeon]|nr:ornithine carbamoyltransferase [Candidatus Micrarchaeaceae archaeon]
MISSVGALAGRDFLDIADLQSAELREVLELAHAIKAGRWTGKPLEGRHIALLFQKPSHRTRVSFEVGIGRLGGRVTNLTEQDVQLGVRETVGDAARVLDSYVDGVVARLRLHADLLELAAASEKPVINALTNRSHPCQILADLMTIEEVCGPLAQQKVVYIGDGNNIAVSLIEAAELMGFSLTLITPPGYAPPSEVMDDHLSAGTTASGITLSSDAADVAGATAIYTDVWASMGQESEREVRRKTFARYQVNDALMAKAADAVFMHCLPAHRGEEVTDDVIDGPRSVVFQQAANRLYAQMALMAQLFGATQ